MKNTFKKLLLCFLAVVAVITGSAAVKRRGQCRKQRRAGQKRKPCGSSKAGLLSARLAGYIAVFEDGRQTPKTVTDIPTETLNNVDREKLRTGIGGRNARGASVAAGGS